MNLLMRWGALFIFTTSLHAACLDMVRASWRMQLPQKSVAHLGQSKSVEKFCAPLVEDPQANILIKLTQGTKKFERRLLVPLYRHWDKLEKGKLTGGAHKETEVSFESLAPTWATKAQIEVVDIATGEVLAKGKP